MNSLLKEVTGNATGIEITSGPKTLQYSDSVPVKTWAAEPEASCLDQAQNLAKLPFAFKHIALMPDTHAGVGMPIGGVLATKGVVIPNAVGVDICCGMRATQLNIQASDVNEELLKHILGFSRDLIPVGFNSHEVAQDWSGFDDIPDCDIPRSSFEKARKQLGTLGGGNHFVEIQKDTCGYLWAMVHSGSRNIGHTIAQHYDKIAKTYTKDQAKEVNLAYLPEGTSEFGEYLALVDWCRAYAKENRRKMMEVVLASLGVDVLFNLDVSHNYVAKETHFGESVYVHRKGAISAKLGEAGIIPGSMGTSSYITIGKGNPESFNSSSHGAGRVMSRKKANEAISEEEATKAMEGILHGRWCGKFDEAPQAYKDIDEVMSSQLDLTTAVTKLSPMAVLKG